MPCKKQRNLYLVFHLHQLQPHTVKGALSISEGTFSQSPQVYPRRCPGLTQGRALGWAADGGAQPLVLLVLDQTGLEAWPMGWRPDCLQLRGQVGLTDPERQGTQTVPGSPCEGAGSCWPWCRLTLNSEYGQKLLPCPKGRNSVACLQDCGPCVGLTSHHSCPC